jgi:hypothetical protein
MVEDISSRMAKMRVIFEEALQTANSENDNQRLVRYLDSIEPQFRSVVYEAASMSRALTSVRQEDDFIIWLSYQGVAKSHAVQVYIGLGWAMAQQQVPLAPILSKIDALYQARVLDGMGYYDGIFRQRRSIRDKVIPEEIKGDMIHGYDQGIGRSLWYHTKGNVSKVTTLAEGFADTRKADIWRGIGIAVSYVGGFDENMLKEIFKNSVGAALLARSRSDAGTANGDSNMACQIWCGISAEKAVSITYQTEPSELHWDDGYIKWVNRIEAGMKQYIND